MIKSTVVSILSNLAHYDGGDIRRMQAFAYDVMQCHAAGLPAEAYNLGMGGPFLHGLGSHILTGGKYPAPLYDHDLFQEALKSPSPRPDVVRIFSRSGPCLMCLDADMKILQVLARLHKWGTTRVELLSLEHFNPVDVSIASVEELNAHKQAFYARYLEGV